MNSKKITFNNAAGVQLSARLELPTDGQPLACAIFAHCFTCSKNLIAISNISRSLTTRGIAVFRFDFTGLGESEGDFADTNFSSNVGDLLAAAEYLQEHYEAPQVLIGHSLGGAAVLQTAEKLNGIKAVATIGAPADPMHVRKHFRGNLEEIEKSGVATVSIGGRPFKIKKQFVDDLENHQLETTISSLNKSLLILHSPQDEIVSIGNARMIYEAAKHPKSFISLDGADHLMSNKKDSLYVGEVIASWVSRYIDLTEKEELATEKQVVTRTGDEGYTTQIKAGKHTFLADEPTEIGGKDLGPTPYDLLIASLGACTGITLRMYANRKGWPLDEIKVHLTHSKIHAQDCEDCETREGKIDHIDRILELEGNLSADQQARLLEIADKCPVHRTLHSEVKIKTELKRR